MDAAVEFERHKGLLYKEVLHQHVRNRDIPKGDLVSEAYLLFHRAIETYDPERAGLTTHLTYQLRALVGVVRHERYLGRKQVFLSSLESSGFEPSIPPARLHKSRADLSSDAQTLLSGLLAGDFDGNKGGNPTKIKAAEQLQWSRTRTRRAWGEVHTWVEEGGVPW